MRVRLSENENWSMVNDDIVGLDIGSFVPFLGTVGSIAGGLLGGGQKAPVDNSTPMMQMMLLQQARRDKETKDAEKKAAARNQTIMYSVLGILGVAVVGGGLYYALKK